MNTHSLTKPFLISLAIFPLTYAFGLSLTSTANAGKVTLLIFALTIAIEVFAVTQFVRARRAFSSGDAGYLTWTLIIAFMGIRLVAEMRLLTINLGLVPDYRDDSPAALFFYIIVLRYLYTLSDLFFVGALVTTIRSYKSTGLPFKLLPVDYLYILGLCTLPVIAYSLRGNLLQSSVSGSDGYIVIYRLVAISVGALMASLCIVVRRFALQMGGGAVAKVWSMVVIAGVARNGSFLALALLSGWSKAGAGFFEQYLLWVFAGCWLLAALYQRDVHSRATKSHPVYVAEAQG